MQAQSELSTGAYCKAQSVRDTQRRNVKASEIYLLSSALRQVLSVLFLPVAFSNGGMITLDR